ncbi:MAG: hypothetical protein H6740_27485 [Alphaproteobacteria bacterium]|nr:hypothetical protein [Alphaproteobacteria bacterium]
MDLLVSTLVPYLPDGTPDAEALAREIHRLGAVGVDGLLPAMGEIRTLSAADQILVGQVSMEAAAGMRCLPCAWSGDPRRLLDILGALVELGVESVVVPPPPGERLSVEALRRWYSAAVDAVGLPLIATAPRSHLNVLTLELLTELYVEGALAGLVDESGDPERLARLCQILPHAVMAAGDPLIAEAGKLPALDGFVTELGALYPRMARQALDDGQMPEAWREALRLSRHGGGLAVLKSALGLGCRAPFELPEPRALRAMPPLEG